MKRKKEREPELLQYRIEYSVDDNFPTERFFMSLNPKDALSQLCHICIKSSPFDDLKQGELDLSTQAFSNPDIDTINKRYDDIKLTPDNNYNRIISCAVLEHITDLPDYLYASSFKLKKGGYQQHSIPCEGYPMWDILWFLFSGILFKLKFGYSDEIRILQVERKLLST